VKKIEDKLNAWELEANNLKAIIGDDDQVWLSWWNLIKSFGANMKWIKKITSDSFKQTHFIELFSAIGLEYDPNKDYTIQDFIDFRLDEYADLIDSIYKRCSVEYQNILKFEGLKELWHKKIQFKLAKTFPIKLYKAGEYFSICFLFRIATWIYSI